MKQGRTKIKHLVIFSALFVAQRGEIKAAEFLTQELMSESQELLMRVHFPSQLPELSQLELISLSRKAFEQSQESFQLTFRDSFDVFFDHRPEQHNGLATVLPQNRIFIHLANPELQAYGPSKDYIYETLLHEMAHMLSIQQRAGLFSVLGPIVGNLSSPVSAWPRWLHEGSAVWAEGIDEGGRPHSGLIAQHLKLFADYKERHNKYPFSNSGMDGSSRLGHVGHGQIPYHFGYLLWQDWINKGGQPERFIKRSAHGPGTSFRRVFRALDHDIDQAFRDAQVKWANTPVAPPPLAQVLTEGSNLSLSQLSSSHYALSWVITDKRRQKLFWRLNRDKQRPLVRSLSLDLSWSRARRFLMPDEKSAWLLTSNPATNPREHAGGQLHLLDMSASNRAQSLCRISKGPQKSSIKDFYVDNKFLYLHSRKKEMAMEQIWRIDVPTAQACAQWPELIDNAKLLAESREPFEQIYGLWAGADHWAYLQGQGRNTWKSQLHWGLADSESSGRQKLPEGIFSEERLSFGSAQILKPSKENSELCPQGSRVCLLTQVYSQDYWGPALIVASSDGQWKLFKQRGGRSSLPPTHFDGRLYFVLDSWEKQGLMSQKIERKHWQLWLSSNESQKSTKEAAPRAAKIEKNTKAPTTYSPWPSIWPHFWLPSAYLDQEGWLAGGSIFYSDLSDTYSGESALFYDSHTKSFSFMTMLHRHFSSASLLRWSFDLGQNTQRLGDLLQRQRRLGTHMSWLAPQWHGFRLHLSPSLSFREWRQDFDTQSVNTERRIVPALRTSLSSPRGRNPRQLNQRMSQAQWGMHAENSTIFLRGWEASSNLDLHGPLPVSGAFLVSAEHFWTRPKNFPLSYQLFGGGAQTAPLPQRFLLRAFPVNFAATRHALRLAAEVALPISNHMGLGIDWNRLQGRSLDLVAITESVSWSSFREESRFRLGRQYFLSSGVELQLRGLALNYTHFKASVGYHRAFGEFKQHRLMLNIDTFLDL